MRIAKAGNETDNGQVKLFLNLDGSGKHKIETGDNVLDAFLTTLAAESGIDLEIIVNGESVDAVTRAINIALPLAKALETTRLMELSDSEQALDNDDIPKLLNRSAVEDRLCGVINETTRFNYPFSIVMFSIDIFSENGTIINSTKKEILQYIDRILELSLRSYDIAARYGELEFILIMPHCEKENAITISNRLNEKVDKLHNAMFHQIDINPSFGVTSVNDLLQTGCEDGIEMLDTASIAMLNAKATDDNERIFFLKYIE